MPCLQLLGNLITSENPQVSTIIHSRLEFSHHQERKQKDLIWGKWRPLRSFTIFERLQMHAGKAHKIWPNYGDFCSVYIKRVGIWQQIGYWIRKEMNSVLFVIIKNISCILLSKSSILLWLSVIKLISRTCFWGKNVLMTLFLIFWIFQSEKAECCFESELHFAIRKWS